MDGSEGASVSCIWVPLATIKTNSNRPPFTIIETAYPLCHGKGMGNLVGLLVNVVAGDKKKSAGMERTLVMIERYRQCMKRTLLPAKDLCSC